MKKAAFLIAVVFALCVSAFGSELYLSPTGPVYVAARNVIWGASGPGAIENNYTFAPFNPSSNVCLLITNNSANAHNFNFFPLASYDPKATSFGPNSARFGNISWVSNPFTKSNTISLFPSSSAIIAMKSNGASMIDFQISGSNAPTSDTADIIIVQTTSSDCPGAFASGFLVGTVTAQTNNPLIVPLQSAALATTADTSQVSRGLITEKGARWTINQSPAVSVQATANRAATANTRHVVDCVAFTLTATAATAGIASFVIRDGVSGGGTVLWIGQLGTTAAIGSNAVAQVCGLNLTGSVNTAMTCEFTAAAASNNETVACSGYDVQ